MVSRAWKQQGLVGISQCRLLVFVLCFSVVNSLFANELEDALFGAGSSSVSSAAPPVEEGASVNADLEADLFSSSPFSSSSMDEDAFFSTGSSVDTSFKDMLSDKLLEKNEQFLIGGEYYHSFSVIGVDNQSTQEHSYSSNGIADIYFDAALDDGVRFFMQQKIEQDFSAPADSSNVVSFSGPEATTSIDQMWLKLNYRNRLYMSFGKQPTSWGAGFVWAPTDFINEELNSPFSLSDQRLGVSLMKFEYPLDSQGVNLYAVFQTDQANNIGEIKSLFRVEKLFEKSELAMTMSSVANNKLQLGLDFSTGFPWFDWYANAGFTKHDDGQYFARPDNAGDITSDDLLGLLQAGVNADPDAVPANVQLLPVDRSDELLKQVSTGIIYIKSFEDNTQLILNSEFLYNEKGYDNDDILTLLLLQNPTAFDPLYFSKRYLAVGFTRAGLGKSSQSYGLQYIKSLSDSSGSVIASFSFKPYRDLNFSSSAIVFTGGSGVFRPFSADTEVLKDTTERVANGELIIPPELQDNLDQLPPVLEVQDTDPITATVGETSFEGPRYVLRVQLSLSF